MSLVIVSSMIVLTLIDDDVDAGEIMDNSEDEYKKDKKRRRLDKLWEEEDRKNEFENPLLAVEDEDAPNAPRTNLAGVLRSTRGQLPKLAAMLQTIHAEQYSPRKRARSGKQLAIKLQTSADTKGSSAQEPTEAAAKG